MTLHVAFAIDNLITGGAQRQAVELAIRLRAEPGIATRVVAYRELDRARDPGVLAARLAAAGVALEVVPKRGKLDPTLPRRLGRWLADAGIDVVHAFMAAPALWSLLAVRTLPRARRPRLVAAERSALANSRGLARIVQGLVYRRADAVTANARPTLAELASELHVPAARLHYLPNGIDLDAWDEAAARPCPFELAPGRFHAALIGRFSAEKNHALLLDALARLAPAERMDWQLWLVGAATAEPDAAGDLDREITRRGLGAQVRVVPPSPDIAAFLRRIDLLVLPSRYEGFPNVVLEAMAAGTLVAAAPVGDVPSLVSDGETGLLFPGEDPEALAAALRRARALPVAQREALVRRARLRVEERYRIQAVAAAHAALYRELVAKPRA